MNEQPGPQEPPGPLGGPWPQQVPVPPNSPPLDPAGQPPYPPPAVPPYGQYAPQPGPPPYQPGYQPLPGPGAPAPRKRHGCLSFAIAAVIAVVVIVIVAAALGSNSSQDQPAAGGGGTGDSGSAASQPAPAGQVAPDPHRVVKDGDFAFRFLGMNCGPSAAARVYNAPDLTGHLPPGTKECLVKLRVTDDKGEAQTWFASDQTAIDARGHRLSADDNDIFLGAAHENTQLNPGVSLTALVPYNMPRGDRIVALELHDSEFSGGVRVRL